MHTTRRGEPLPINQALEQTEGQARPRPLGMDGHRVRNGDGFPRRFPNAGNPELSNIGGRRMVDRP